MFKLKDIFPIKIDKDQNHPLVIVDSINKKILKIWKTQILLNQSSLNFHKNNENINKINYFLINSYIYS